MTFFAHQPNQKQQQVELISICANVPLDKSRYRWSRLSMSLPFHFTATVWSIAIDLRQKPRTKCTVGGDQLNRNKQ